eukprot:SAG31_NODE_2364_length_5860_cov_11.314529_2_plen_711_part_00
MVVPTRSVAIVMLMLLSCPLTMAVLDKTYGPARQAGNAAFISNLQQKDGTFGDVFENYYGIVSMQKLGQPLVKAAGQCATTAAALPKLGTDIESISAAVATLRAAECTNELGVAGSTPGLVDAVQVALESREPRDIYFGTLAAVSLPDGAVDVEFIRNAMQPLASGWNAAVRGSAISAGYAFAAASLAIRDGKLANAVSASTLADQLLSEATATLNMAKAFMSTSEMLCFVDHEADDHSAKFANLRATSIVLAGLNDLATASNTTVALEPETLAKIAAFVLQNQSPGTVETAFYFLNAMEIFTSPYAANPVVVAKLPTPQMVLGAKGAGRHVQVRISDLLDHPIGNAQVQLRTVTFMEGTEESTSLVEASAKDKIKFSETETMGIYSVDFLSLARTGHGPYYVRAAVNAMPSRFGTSDVVRPMIVKVSTAVELVEFSVLIRKDKGLKPSSQVEISHADAPRSIAVQSTDHITVQFKVRSSPEHGGDGSFLHPHQAMARIHQGLNEVILVAFPDESDPDLLKIEISIDDSIRKVHDASVSSDRQYRLQILIGDFFATNSIQWDAATLNLQSSYAVQGSSKKSSPPVIKGPRPIIVHEFRQPEARPPRIVSLIFSAATLTPLLFLLWAFGRLGVNIHGLPRHGVGLAPLWAVTFHVTLGIMLYQLVQFWIDTPIFVALQRLLVSSLVAAFTGRKALRASVDFDARGDQKKDA